MSNKIQDYINCCSGSSSVDINLVVVSSMDIIDDNPEQQVREFPQELLSPICLIYLKSLST
jgi:hypothetical protein